MDADADEIRRKRLERLGSSTTSPPASPSSKSQQPAVKKALVALPTLDDQTVVKKPVLKPKTTSPVVSNPIQKPKINQNLKPNPAAHFASLTDEQWEISICESVLGVSLEDKPGMIHLKSVVIELKEENLPVLAVYQNWERILYARISAPENSSDQFPALFDYLRNSWLKAQVKHGNLLKLISNPGIKDMAARRAARLSEFGGLIMNYVGLVINPDTVDMFPSNHDLGAGYFGTKMCTSDPEMTYPRHFIDSLISRFENENLLEIFSATVKSILTVMRTKRIYEDYQTSFRALGYLASFKFFAEKLTLLPEWNPDYATARSIETLSILGPFFSRTSVFPDSDPTLSSRYFGSNGVSDSLFDYEENGIGNRNYGDIKASQSAMRDISAGVQTNLYELVWLLIKANIVSKENILQFFAKAVNLNEKRGKMQVNRNEVSTDGFMHNILQVLKKLSEPLLDANYSKLHLIDANYFMHPNRFKFDDETRINADKETTDRIISEWGQANPATTSNFVTDIFFMTIAYHHFGLLSTIRYYKNFAKEVEQMQKQGAKHAAARDSGQWNALNPMMRANHEQGLARFQGELDKLIGVKLAMEAGLFDTPMLEQSIRLYNLVMLWLIKVASGTNEKIQWNRVAQGVDCGLKLFPLPAELPKAFIILPEWIIDDICDFYSFLMRYQAPIFENTARDEFITFSMVMLSNSAYIKNPYLKSKLVEILFTFTLPLWRTVNQQTMGHLDGPFLSHNFAKKYLVPSILSFYVEVEQTGMNSQFYDKFNIRYNISQIMKRVWKDSGHRANIVRLSTDTDFFVKFVNLLMNDTTFLLDESLSKLKEIGVLQNELAIPLTTDDQSERQNRQQREASLEQNEHHAQTYVSLANETVHMLSFLTAHPDIVGPFMANEIVGRLAAMLDFNLVVLVGPRSTELKVQNPEKYRFDPKKLLNELVSIFLNLSHRSEFIQAVARDGRSYDRKIFHHAAQILGSRNLKNESEINELLKFVQAVDEVIATETKEEEELGEIPDEFLDPLLYTLMEEPVILPSNISVDLSTIRAHLLSDSHDPFNRQPLNIEDVVPNTELKAKIQAWKDSRK